MILREKLLNKKTIFEGKKYSVNIETVELENGHIIERETLVRKEKGASAVLLVDEEDYIYLVKQYRHGLGMESLELPGGKFGSLEDPQDAAYREMEEETGLKPLNLKLLGQIYPTVGSDSRSIYIYYANHYIQGTNQLDEDEQIEVVKIKLQDALALIDNNEIVDAKTITGILMYQFKKGKNL